MLVKQQRGIQVFLNTTRHVPEKTQTQYCYMRTSEDRHRQNTDDIHELPRSESSWSCMVDCEQTAEEGTVT